MNRAILTGRLGRDPEIQHTQTGKAVASFSIAVSEKWSSNGEKKERVDWLTIIAWDKLAELCGQYLSKGSKVLVEGKIQTRSYDDKSGNKRYVTEIVAQNVEFLNSKRQESAHDDPGVGGVAGGGSVLDSDDIPFMP